MSLHQTLFINGRFLTQQVSGVQAFARTLCRELAVETEFRLLVPPGTDAGDSVLASHLKTIGISSGHFWEQAALPFHMLRHPQATLLNLCNTAPLTLSHQAVTIHDLAFLQHPEWFNAAFSKYYSFAIPKLVKKSRVILTVSETMKQEICNRFKVMPNHVHVIGNKVDAVLLEAESKAPLQGSIRPENFFLMVGTMNPRKNFALAEKLFKLNPGMPTLVIAGGSHKSFSESPQGANATNIIRTGYSGYGELRWLYENAIGYINPSLYEGFGLTNLEAMAFGCPVICSDLPVFREVCGDVPWYFDPTDAGSLKNAIDRLLCDTEMKVHKSSSGKSIFTTFQQKNRAAALLKILFE